MLTGNSLGAGNLPFLLTWCFSGWWASFSLWFSRRERATWHVAAVPGRAGTGTVASGGGCWGAWGAPLLGDLGEGTLQEAPGHFTLAAASFVNLCGSSPLQCPCAICPGCAGGDRETPTAPTGDAAIGNCCRSPLWFNHSFPVLFFPFPVLEAVLHGATVTKLAPSP